MKCGSLVKKIIVIFEMAKPEHYAKFRALRARDPVQLTNYTDEWEGNGKDLGTNRNK